MLWSEIKRWAKDMGYDTIKDKEDGKYYWTKHGSSDSNDCGVVTSVSKLAKAIFNHSTNNIWLDHQIDFKNKQDAQVNIDYGIQ